MDAGESGSCGNPQILRIIGDMAKRAIITGATSGIGRALAVKLAQEGYTVGVTGRRLERLEELRAQFPEQIQVTQMDVTKVDDARTKFDQLIQEMGGLDLAVINAGIGRPNPDFELEPEMDTVMVNVVGFVATLQKAAEHFLQQGSGQIVGVSSIAALFGNSTSPAYNASKVFELNYLEGIYAKLRRKGIAVTDIRPGFVATEIAGSTDKRFWEASSGKAAEQIYRAIVKRKRYAYITRRWRLIAWLIRLLPNWIRRQF